MYSCKNGDQSPQQNEFQKGLDVKCNESRICDLLVLFKLYLIGQSLKKGSFRLSWVTEAKVNGSCHGSGNSRANGMSDWQMCAKAWVYMHKISTELSKVRLFQKPFAVCSHANQYITLSIHLDEILRFARFLTGSDVTAQTSVFKNVSGKSIRSCTVPVNVAHFIYLFVFFL